MFAKCSTFKLNQLEKQLFNKELLDTVLSIYYDEMESTGCDISEQDYRDAKKALPHMLTDEQKAVLDKVEQLFTEQMQYCVKYGFLCGVCAQTEKETDIQVLFQMFVNNQLLTVPNAYNFPEYSQRQDKINHIYGELEAQLEDEAKTHIISVYTALENRVYGILRHMFQFGIASAQALTH